MTLVCEEVLRIENVEALGHTDDAGIVTIAPTCVTKGVRTYNCAVCKAYLRTEEISELYSSPVDAETGLAATCEHTTEESGKAEHSFGDWKVTQEPTEEAEGSKERTCTVCGYKATETNVINLRTI